MRIVYNPLGRAPATYHGLATTNREASVSLGVRLIGGSDCRWDSGSFGDFRAVVISMADFGLSPMEAVLTGTRDAATAIGKPDSLGTLEPGREADLLLVDGNPVEDLQVLRRVQSVYHGGRQVNG